MTKFTAGNAVAGAILAITFYLLGYRGLGLMFSIYMVGMTVVGQYFLHKANKIYWG